MLIHWHTYLLHYPYTQHTLIYTCTSTLSTSWVDTLPNSMKWPTFSIYMKLGHVWAIAYFVTNKCFVTAIQHKGIKWENVYINIHMYLNINKLPLDPWTSLQKLRRSLWLCLLFHPTSVGQPTWQRERNTAIVMMNDQKWFYSLAACIYVV